MQNYILWIFKAEQQFLRCFSFIQSKNAPKKCVQYLSHEQWQSSDHLVSENEQNYRY